MPRAMLLHEDIYVDGMMRAIGVGCPRNKSKTSGCKQDPWCADLRLVYSLVVRHALLQRLT